MRLRIRVLLHALRKPFVPPFSRMIFSENRNGTFRDHAKEGRRSAERRTTFRPAAARKACQRMRRAPSLPPAHGAVSSGDRSPFGAPPRSLARALPRLSSGPRFLGSRIQRELPSPAPVSQLLAVRSSAGGRCPEPPGAGCEAAPGTALAPPSVVTRKCPSMSELGYVTIMGTNVKTCPDPGILSPLEDAQRYMKPSSRCLRLNANHV